MHYVSSIIETKSRAVPKRQKSTGTGRDSSKVDLSAVCLSPPMCVAMGVWVETTEPSWVCSIFNKASFRSLTQRDAGGLSF